MAVAGDPLDLPTSEASGTAVAADLRFAARAAEVVLELITRGRVLPTLESTPNQWVARWRPVIDGLDRGRIEALRWALPASLLAAGADGRGQNPGDGIPEGETPDEALRSLMWGFTDALARQLAAERRPADRADRRPRTDAPTDGAGHRHRASSTPGWPLWPPPTESSRRMATSWRHCPESSVTGRLRRPRWPNRCVPASGSSPRKMAPMTIPGAETDDGPDRPGRRRPRRGVERSDEWRIEFDLQAVDDPSLLVTADAVWSDGPELTALERHVAHPDEHLLRGLGRAARLVPSLGPALAEMAPSGQSTDATGILAFLRDGAPVLEEAGFGVMAPPWWRSSRARLALRLKARTGTKTAGPAGAIGLDGLCDIRWEAVLGDDTLGLTELRQLARLKQPLVRLRGQWVELHEEDLAAAITAVAKKGATADQSDGRRGAADRPRSRADPGGPPGGLGGGGRLARGPARRGRRPAPPWLSRHRRASPASCARIRSADSDGWPSSETSASGPAWPTIWDSARRPSSSLCWSMSAPGVARRRLIGRPSRRPRGSGDPTVRPWVRPSCCARCPWSATGSGRPPASPRSCRSTSITGRIRLGGKAFTRHAGTVDLVLSTYGLAARDQQLLATVPWRRMVLDEAQQIKNSAARTTQSVRAIPAERRIAMTGTPVENRLSELWSIMQFLNPGMLGSERTFRERFAIPIERDGDDEAAARLRHITGPFVLRRLKTDRSIIADLPDKLEMKEFCNLTREQATLYQAVVDDMLARIDEAEGIERRGLVLATMMKLKQVCNHPAHFLGDGSSIVGRSGKVSRLVEVLEEAVAEGDRSLVFTQFTEMGDMLERHLRQTVGLRGALAPRRGAQEEAGRNGRAVPG